MERHLLGKTLMSISPVIYGGIVSMNESQENSDFFVSWAVENGVNYFDVAPTYGDAQQKLGHSLIPYRQNIYLACKTADRTAEGSKKELDESLRLLRTDYFDVYQMHALNTIDDINIAFSKNGVMTTLMQAKQEGIVRYLGITCHNEEAALYALELHPFDTVMFPINWGMNMGKGFGNRIRDSIKSKNIGFIGIKSLIHRAWKGNEEQNKSLYHKSWCKPIYEDETFAKTAIKYAFSMGINATIPPGNFEHFKFTVNHIDECLSEPLKDNDIHYLKQKLNDVNHAFIF